MAATNVLLGTERERGGKRESEGEKEGKRAIFVVFIIYGPRNVAGVFV